MRRPSHSRSAIAVVGAVLLLAGSGLVDAAPPVTEPGAGGLQSIGEYGRFTRYALPASIDLSGLPLHTDPNTVVTVVVQVAGGSTLDGTPEAQVEAVQAQVSDGLEAAGAVVTDSTEVVLSSVTAQVAVRDLDALATVPGVQRVHVSRRITLANATSNAATGAAWAWSNLGVTGAGTTIGILDDGIDYYHSTFGGSGDPADYANDDGLAIEPGTFPTSKVLGGYDFAGDAYDADADEPGESTTPVPDPDPLACGEHGTHVAGTAAGQGVLADGSTFTGPYDSATVGAQTFKVAPGSAPEAGIFAYKVFGCDGSSGDDVILAAIEQAVIDGVDVINMSLGSAFGTADEPLALAIEAATAAGVLVVVSAGNEGPNGYLVGGPSTANSALSVAAVDSTQFIPGAEISGAISLVAQNSNGVDLTAPVTGELVDVGVGCSVADFAPAAGKIAIATRGVCTRVERAVHATDAGALAVLFINNAAGLPPVEGPIPGATVPFIGIAGSDGPALLSVVGQTVSIAGGAPLPNPGYRGFADFTSEGPRTGDSAAKPDVSAPGVNVLSAFAGSGSDGILLSGTSMAAPHAAGIALLVRQANPSLTPIQVKAALMGTANSDGIAGFQPRRGGAGLISAYRATRPHTVVTTPDGLNNVSFGFSEIARSTTLSETVDVTNLTGRAITYDVSAWIGTGNVAGITVSVSPRTLRIPAGQTRTVRTTLRINDPAALPKANDSDGGDLYLLDGILNINPRLDSGVWGRVVVPIVMVPSGLSNVGATYVPARGSSPAALRVRNAGRHSGDADVYQWAISDAEGDSPDPRVSDLRSIGVQSFDFGGDQLVVFAVNSWGRSSTQSVNEYDLFIDVDLDGTPDYLLIAADTGLLTSGVPDGTMSVLTLAADGTPVALYEVGAPANGSTVFIPMLASDLGITGPFVFGGLSATVVDTDADVDTTDPAIYDPFAPAVSNGDYVSLRRNQRVDLPVWVDPAAAALQNPWGWLVVTVDDAGGSAEANEVLLP
jgi:minor extracellular serine protease Vpr